MLLISGLAYKIMSSLNHSLSKSNVKLNYDFLVKETLTNNICEKKKKHKIDMTFFKV